MFRVIFGFVSFFIVSIALLAFLLSGSSRVRADLVVIESDEAKTLDPHTSTGVTESRIMRELFEPLLREQADASQEPGHGVAHHVQVSSDARSYTFRIRPDNYWVSWDKEKARIVRHRAVSAQDFRYAWFRVLDPRIASEYVYQLFYILNAEAYHHSEFIRQNIGRFAEKVFPNNSKIQETQSLIHKSWRDYITHRAEAYKVFGASRIEADALTNKALLATDTYQNTILHLVEEELRSLSTQRRASVYTGLEESTRRSLISALFHLDSKRSHFISRGEEEAFHQYQKFIPSIDRFSSLNEAELKAIPIDDKVKELLSISQKNSLYDFIQSLPFIHAKIDILIMKVISERFSLLMKKDDVGIIAHGDDMLSVKLEASVPYMQDLFVFHTFYPVPREPIEKLGHRWHKWVKPEYIWTNGAYVLSEWRAKWYKRLVRNHEYYWDRNGLWGPAKVSSTKKPLDVIDFVPVTNSITQFNAYITGAGDWYESLPLDLGESLRKERDQGYRQDLLLYPYLGTYYYRFNCLPLRKDGSINPFADPRVRKAFSLSIDRNYMTREVLTLGEVPTSTFVPSSYIDKKTSKEIVMIPSYKETAERFHHLFPDLDLRVRRPGDVGGGLGYDTEKAKKLLEEAGWSNLADFPSTKLLYNTSEGHRLVASTIRAEIRRNLGLKSEQIELMNMGWRDYLREQRNLNYSLSRAGWIGDYNDANTFLDMWVTNGGNNQTGWSLPLYDELIRLTKDIDRFIDDPQKLFSMNHPNQIEGFRNKDALIHAYNDYNRLNGALEKDLNRIESLRDLLRGLLQYESEFILVEDEVPILNIYHYASKNLIPLKWSREGKFSGNDGFCTDGDSACLSRFPSGAEKAQRTGSSYRTFNWWYEGYVNNARNIHPIKYFLKVTSPEGLS